MKAERARSSDRWTARTAALFVVEHLQEAGHVALFAGGCVRDMLMKREPKDYDVATSAPPEVVVKLFRRTQQVGAKFGVVLVKLGSVSVEVATFRRDVDYQDGRRPNRVEFTDAREDAERRDFTINGMFYDPLKREVVDYVQGQADLKKGVIRAIGDPALRFAEDHLRMLRAIRFGARLGFSIERATRRAIVEHAPEIKRITPERIHSELEGILTSAGRGGGVEELFDSGLMRHLWPGADSLYAYEKQIVSVMAALPKGADFELALAALLFPLSSADAGNVCDALRCSNKTREHATWLVRHQDDLIAESTLSLADLKLLMAGPAFESLGALCGAKLTAMKDSPARLRKVLSRARKLSPEQVTPPPLLTGHDLAKLGVPQGPAYAKILKRVYYAQLNDELTTAAEARELAKTMI